METKKVLSLFSDEELETELKDRNKPKIPLQLTYLCATKELRDSCANYIKAHLNTNIEMSTLRNTLINSTLIAVYGTDIFERLAKIRSQK